MARFAKGRLGAAVAAAATAAAVMAASPAGGQALEPARRTLDAARPTLPDAQRAPLPDGSGIPPSRLAPVEGDEPFVLRGVTVAGATLYGEAELAPIWADLVGQEVSPRQAAVIAQAVETFYREQGYVFTRVLPGPADAAAGLIPIEVVEARIDVVSIEEPEGPIGPVRNLMARLAAPLEGKANPTLADLERVLLLLNDIPGVTRATAVPRAGDGGVGSVALTINATRDPVGGALFADNRQAPAFGPGLIGVFAEARSYTSAGDTTGVTLTNSVGDSIFEDIEKRWIAQVEHARHVGALGTRVGARALVSASNPGEELASLDLDSEELEAELWAEHPVVLSRPLSFWVRGGFDYRDSNLDRGGRLISDDDTRVLFLEGRALTRDAGGYVFGTLALRQGLDILDATPEGSATASRGDGDATATAVFASLEREQALGGTFTLFGRAEAQYAFDPLLASQEFALGGTTFGRGYDPSETLGDHGIGATLELRKNDRLSFGDLNVGTTVYGFADYGRVWNIDPGVPDADELVSIGLGVRAQLSSAAQIGVELAQPMGEVQRTGSRQTRLFLSAQIRF